MPHDVLFFSESQFKSFSALTVFDSPTSSNIQQRLRNLLLLCSSWNQYNRFMLYISSATVNWLFSRTLLMCFSSSISRFLGSAHRWHCCGKPRRDGADPLSQLRKLQCLTRLLIWCKAAYHSDTMLSQFTKGHIGHTLIYVLFLFWLLLIRNDANWPSLFDLL